MGFLLSLSLQLSWSKRLVRKWFNIKNKAHDFNADEDDAIRGFQFLPASRWSSRQNPYINMLFFLFAGGKNGDWRKDSFSETGREDEISSYKVKKSRTGFLLLLSLYFNSILFTIYHRCFLLQRDHHLCHRGGVPVMFTVERSILIPPKLQIFETTGTEYS